MDGLFHSLVVYWDEVSEKNVNDFISTEIEFTKLPTAIINIIKLDS